MISAHLSDGRLIKIKGPPEFTRTAYMVSRPDALEGWSWFQGSIEKLKSSIAECLNSIT